MGGEQPWGESLGDSRWLEPFDDGWSHLIKLKTVFERIDWEEASIMQVNHVY